MIMYNMYNNLYNSYSNHNTYYMLWLRGISQAVTKTWKDAGRQRMAWQQEPIVGDMFLAAGKQSTGPGTIHFDPNEVRLLQRGRAILCCTPKSRIRLALYAGPVLYVHVFGFHFVLPGPVPPMLVNSKPYCSNKSTHMWIVRTPGPGHYFLSPFTPVFV